MDLPIVGAAWPEEQEALVAMAQVLSVALRVQSLRFARALPAAQARTGAPRRRAAGRHRGPS